MSTFGSDSEVCVVYYKRLITITICNYFLNIYFRLVMFEFKNKYKTEYFNSLFFFIVMIIDCKINFEQGLNLYFFYVIIALQRLHPSGGIRNFGVGEPIRSGKYSSLLDFSNSFRGSHESSHRINQQRTQKF